MRKVRDWIIDTGCVIQVSSWLYTASVDCNVFATLSLQAQGNWSARADLTLNHEVNGTREVLSNQSVPSGTYPCASTSAFAHLKAGEKIVGTFWTSVNFTANNGRFIVYEMPC